MQNQHKQVEREPDLIGSAAFLTEYRQMAESMQNSTNPVLITGECGTGKTQLAQYLCYHSSSSSKSPQIIWLDEITEELLDHELFGYCNERGNEHEGKIKAADGCTIILKDIAYLSLHLQAKILHLIENGEFGRIGDDKCVRVNVRILCTTCENLRQLVIENKFRKDLYYLLSAAQIILQPLRNRPADVNALGNHFLLETAKQQNKRISAISSDAMDVLQKYCWPGNVRELKAEIVQAVSKVPPHQLTLEKNDISLKVRFNYMPVGMAEKTGFYDGKKEIERQMIIEAIERHDGNKSSAARALGIKHRTLYQKMKSLGIPLNVRESPKV